MNIFDREKKPPIAYTKAHAIRLVREFEECRKKAFLRPHWKPGISWRLTGGGCYNPDPNDPNYIDGKWTFKWPGNSKLARRTLARREYRKDIRSTSQVPWEDRWKLSPYYKTKGDGRRRSVRVPVMDWIWFEPKFK